VKDVVPGRALLVQVTGRTRHIDLYWLHLQRRLGDLLGRSQVDCVGVESQHGVDRIAVRVQNVQRHSMLCSGTLQWEFFVYYPIIGKYLSCLRKLHHVIAPKEGFEAQLRAPRVPITVGMSALGMTRQIGDGHLQRVIEPCHVPGLQCLDNPA